MVARIGAVPWKGHPFLPSALETPGQGGAVGPLHGRHDEGAAMPEDAQPTPASNWPQEVTTDDVSPEADSTGPE
jgi:hypothetical protein